MDTDGTFLAPLKKAFVLDDNDDDALYMSLILREQRYQIQRACSIADASHLLEAQNPDFDVYVVDMWLPTPQDRQGVDGYYFIAFLRKQMKSHEIPRVPIIAISSNLTDLRQERCIEAGADVITEKPLSRDALKTALELDLAQTPADQTMLDSATDFVNYIKRTASRPTVNVGRLVLTAISPALHFDSEADKQAAHDKVYELGGKAAILTLLDELRIELADSPHQLDTLCKLLRYGVSQEAILKTLGIGRRKFNTHVAQLIDLLTQKIQAQA